jgi:hypothetical protein
MKIKYLGMTFGNGDLFFEIAIGDETYELVNMCAPKGFRPGMGVEYRGSMDMTKTKTGKPKRQHKKVVLHKK